MEQSQEIAAIAHLIEKIEGFLGKHEGRYLYHLARQAAPLGAIVEIGSFKGKSTVWLANGSLSVNGHPVYAIDPHLGGEEYRGHGIDDRQTEKIMKQNLQRAGVEQKVIPVVKSSMAALEGWDRPVGFLWIDGDHSYDAVAQDFYRWSPHLVDGGIIALHDTYSWEGVRRLVDNEILLLDDYRVLGQVDGILAVQKTAKLSAQDRTYRGIVRLLRRVFNYARSTRKHWRAFPRKVLRGLARAKS